jgi:hypothetical protein
MGAGRPIGWCAIALALAASGVAARAEGQPRRARASVTWVILEGAKRESSSVTIELLDPGNRRAGGLARLTLTGTREGLRVISSTARLPTLRVGAATFETTWGDHQLQLGSPAIVLQGWSVEARSVRGLSLQTGREDAKAAILLGRLDLGRTDPLRGWLPHLLVVQGTLKPWARLTLAPRAVARLGGGARSPGTDPTVGLGSRIDVRRDLSLLADASASRAAHGWAPVAVAGLLGHWSRGRIDASVARANPAARWLGTLPLAGRDRAMVAGQLTVAKGVRVDGSLSRTAPYAKPGSAVARAAGSFDVRVDRVVRTTLTLGGRRESWRGGASTVVTMDARPGGRLPVLRVERRSDEALGPANSRKTHVTRLLAEGGLGWAGRATLAYKAAWRLATPGGAAPAFRTEMGGRFPLHPRVTLMGDMHLELAPRRVQMVSLGSDVGLTDLTTLTLGFRHTAGIPRGARLEGRLTRVISF